jgi:hypothetical protein
MADRDHDKQIEELAPPGVPADNSMSSISRADRQAHDLAGIGLQFCQETSYAIQSTNNTGNTSLPQTRAEGNRLILNLRFEDWGAAAQGLAPIDRYLAEGAEQPWAPFGIGQSNTVDWNRPHTARPSA